MSNKIERAAGLKRELGHDNPMAEALEEIQARLRALEEEVRRLNERTQSLIVYR